jgi:glycosyltransferase involved in cell wall biosynthesis
MEHKDPALVTDRVSDEQGTEKNNVYSIGVVIPTYNRIDTLLTCLLHLESQTWKDFEVVVVDDGSTDSTPQAMTEYQARSPFPIRYITQSNSGPATARNRAVKELNSANCLFLGDDIFASPDLVRLHAEHHQSHPEMKAAAVGLTRWSQKGQTVTPFMRWLDTDGEQFSYGELLKGVPASWKHFYTSNLSLKTEQLRRNPFDERFRKAAMEDAELGYRLSVANELEISFLPDAVAEHLHPTSFRQTCRRMIGVGASAYLFGKIWPEHQIPSAGATKRKIRSLLQQPWILARLMNAAALLTEISVPNPLMKKVLALHATLGYRQAAQQDDAASK